MNFSTILSYSLSLYFFLFFIFLARPLICARFSISKKQLLKLYQNRALHTYIHIFRFKFELTVRFLNSIIS